MSESGLPETNEELALELINQAKLLQTEHSKDITAFAIVAVVDDEPVFVSSVSVLGSSLALIGALTCAAADLGASDPDDEDDEDGWDGGDDDDDDADDEHDA